MFNNQRGTILVNVLITAAVVGIAIAFMLDKISKSNDFAILPKVRSTMAQTEIQARALAYSPRGYTNCDSNVGPASCIPNSSEYSKLSTKDVGVQLLGYDPSVLKMQIEIAYRGSTISIQPRIVDLQIPAEVLQSASFQCPTSQPIFVGFDAQGRRQCRGLPATVCPTGQYVSSINIATLEPTCTDAGRFFTCLSINEYVSTLTWTGAGIVTFSCAPRPSPFAYF
ncbi:MAG: hypothetical protein V4760_08905, partial [Bdellovibrionota bacterium]